jgi:putative membrane protein
MNFQIRVHPLILNWENRIGGFEMKNILLVVCCLCLCTFAALGETKPAKASVMSGQRFIDFAAQTDMVEANLGQLAQTAADSPELREYAQTLVTDHTSDFNELSGVARQEGLTVPSAIDAEHNKEMIGPIEKLKGATFDHRYIEDLIAAHEKGIAMYRKEAADARDPALKSYAEHALPVLEKHLAAAIKLEKAKS